MNLKISFPKLVPPRPPILGLDISDNAVRLVALGRNGNRYELIHADAEDLPAGAVHDRDIADGVAVSQALRTLLDRSRIRIKSVATALPVNAVIIKVISLPADLDSMGIDGQIRYEGTQHIPFSMDAVNFDFTILGPDEHRPDFNTVLLIAAKKEDIEDRSAILEEAGLKPKLMDVKSFALWKLYAHHKAPTKDQAVALVEIGGDATHVYVFHNDQPVYNKDHNFGLNRLIENIQNQYSLSAIDAKRMERFGGLPKEYEKEVRQPFVQQTAQEILRALDFFQASMPDVNIVDVALMSSGSKTEGLLQAVQSRQKNSSFSVSVIDPFEGMDISSKINRKFLDTERNALAVACGLALRRFDK